MAKIATCCRRNTDESNARFGFLCYFSSLPLFYSIRRKAFIFFTWGEADRKRLGKCCSSGDHFDSNLLSYPANVQSSKVWKKKKTFFKNGCVNAQSFCLIFWTLPFQERVFLGGQANLFWQKPHKCLFHTPCKRGRSVRGSFFVCVTKLQKPVINNPEVGAGLVSQFSRGMQKKCFQIFFGALGTWIFFRTVSVSKNRCFWRGGRIRDFCRGGTLREKNTIWFSFLKSLLKLPS